MKVYVKGQGEVTLSKTDFVGAGGQASIYAKGGRSFKLYTDPSGMIPAGKLHELANITDPNVIKPEHLIVDKAGSPLGYEMRFIPDAVVLCQLFPPVFRQRNGITPQKTLDLVLSLRQRVANIHAAHVLVVDLNEMNFLVDQGFAEVYAIDVDSYQTAHYPATAIMPSIRDPQVKGLDFTELSDWFSFAIVSFSLFTGIHPYKGNHPSIKGFEDRMAAGVSVFNSDVTVPRVVLPFDVIPEAWRAWYRAVLEDGKRLAPPKDPFGVALVVTPVVRTIGGTGNFDIIELYDLQGQVQGLWESAGLDLIWTTDALYQGNRRLHGEVTGVFGVGFTPRANRAVLAGTTGGRLRLFDAEGRQEIPVDLRADEVVSYAGHIYLRSRDKILELVLNDVGAMGQVVVGSRVAMTCLEYATRLFPGGAIQSLLGDTWVALFPRSGTTFQLHVPELDAYKIIEAKFDGGVLMILGAKHKGGQYDRLVIRFADDFKTYDLRVVEDTTPTGLNFVTLDSGVCVCLTEEEKVEVFSRRPGSAGIKVVADPILGGDMILGKQGGRVVFWRGNKVYSLRMK
jgi:hypothetical protein